MPSPQSTVKDSHPSRRVARICIWQNRSAISYSANAMSNTVFSSTGRQPNIWHRAAVILTPP